MIAVRICSRRIEKGLEGAPERQPKGTFIYASEAGRFFNVVNERLTEASKYYKRKSISQEKLENAAQ